MVQSRVARSSPLALLCWAVACGSGSNPSAPSDADGGNAQTDASAPVDSGSADADAATTPGVACGPSDTPAAPDLTLTCQVYSGAANLYGTIALPAPLSNNPVRLGLSDMRNPSSSILVFNEGTAAILPGPGATITYAIKNLRPGTYAVSLLVERDGNTVWSEADWGGYIGGTTAAPVMTAQLASPITVGATSLCGLDFGVGPIRCLAKYGETCAVDADCRGTKCECTNGQGGWSGVQFCDTSTHQCAPADCAKSCQNLGGVKSTSELGCLG